jgi:hypothetical protein
MRGGEAVLEQGQHRPTSVIGSEPGFPGQVSQGERAPADEGSGGGLRETERKREKVESESGGAIERETGVRNVSNPARRAGTRIYPRILWLLDNTSACAPGRGSRACPDCRCADTLWLAVGPACVSLFALRNNSHAPNSQTLVQ